MSPPQTIALTSMYSLRDIGDVIATAGRLLAFRNAVVDEKRRGPLYVLIGLVLACLAGIGRHWDNPRLGPWQHLGLDSVAYVFVFAAIVWLLLWPMRPSNWRYSTILIFVALTSPPAFLYALPSIVAAALSVDDFVHFGPHWLSRDEFTSESKTWLLLFVAIWRVALFARFLHRPAGLRAAEIVVATLLPLIVIIVTLTSLNLDRAVFEIMGGRGVHTVDDGSYAVLNLITFLSILLFPPLLIAYLAICWLRARERRSAMAST
jgi:hypothetical protein